MTLVEQSLVSVSAARQLLAGANGRPVARATVLSRAARGELELHVICGRFAITRASIDTYLARRAAGREELVAVAS